MEDSDFAAACPFYHFQAHLLSSNDLNLSQNSILHGSLEHK